MLFRIRKPGIPRIFPSDVQILRPLFRHIEAGTPLSAKEKAPEWPGALPYKKYSHRKMMATITASTAAEKAAIFAGERGTLPVTLPVQPLT